MTDTHGKVKHRGNWVVANTKNPDADDRTPNQNFTDLNDRLPVKAYLTPHSDIVALLVLEHQADVHNRLSRANSPQTRRSGTWECCRRTRWTRRTTAG